MCRPRGRYKTFVYNYISCSCTVCACVCMWCQSVITYAHKNANVINFIGSVFLFSHCFRPKKNYIKRNARAERSVTKRHDKIRRVPVGGCYFGKRVCEFFYIKNVCVVVVSRGPHMRVCVCLQTNFNEKNRPSRTRQTVRSIFVGNVIMYIRTGRGVEYEIVFLWDGGPPSGFWQPKPNESHCCLPNAPVSFVTYRFFFVY